jgi:hypothetical protein
MNEERKERDKGRFKSAKVRNVDQDSSAGIATRYGLDGPGIEFR